MLENDGHIEPYHVLLSEIMLQQTQVDRVVPKYTDFLKRFPDIYTLASAPLSSVLQAWQGLGYNRRAKYLHQSAKIIVQKQAGVISKDISDLTALPGIGHNTASAIVVYAYNQPSVFIETNIRSVFLHHFFTSKEAVTDKEILAVVGATLPVHDPRQWYWALMDYGTFLKSTEGAVHRRSAHYKKQTKFQGSVRQLRGQILKELAKNKCISLDKIEKNITDKRLFAVLADLKHDGLISIDGKKVKLG